MSLKNLSRLKRISLNESYSGPIFDHEKQYLTGFNIENLDTVAEFIAENKDKKLEEINSLKTEINCNQWLYRNQSILNECFNKINNKFGTKLGFSYDSNSCGEFKIYNEDELDKNLKEIGGILTEVYGLTSKIKGFGGKNYLSIKVKDNFVISDQILSILRKDLL